MGLDMYLEKRTYVKRWDFYPDDKKFSVTVNRGGEPYAPIKADRVSYVIEEVAYWRKANAIHQWFVDNVQDGVDDCGYYYADDDKLKELLSLVNDVLDGKAKPQDSLPTQSGFFFGSTDYDEYYMEDMKETKRQLTEILSENNENSSFYYHSSW